MLPLNQILYLEKKRVGEHVEQSTVLQYKDERFEAQNAEPIAAGSHVIIADDFTNSGSTLFGGANVVRDSAEDGQGWTLTVEAYVTHFVAKCECPPPEPIGRHTVTQRSHRPPHSQTTRRRSRRLLRSSIATSNPTRLASALSGC